MNRSSFLRHLSSDKSAALYSLFCAGLIIFGVAFFICFRTFESARENALVADKTAASFLAYFLAEHDKSTLGDMLSYAERPLLIKAVKENDLATIHAHLEGMKRNNPEIDLIFLTDRSATILANYPVFPEAIGQNVSDRDWYQGVSARWQPYTSSVFRLIIADKPLAVAVAVPIKDEEGNVIGILGNSHRLDFMARIIQNNYLRPDTTVNILDRKGQILFSSKYPFRDKVAEYPLFSLVQQTQEQNGYTIEATETANNEGAVYLTPYSVGSTGRTVVVERSRADILRSVYGSFLEIGSIGLLLFSLAGIFLFYNRKVFELHTAREQLVERTKSEEALHESEERYRAVVQNTTAIILRVDPQGIIRFANERALQFFGYSAEELIGKHAVGTIVPERESTGRDLAAMVDGIAENPDHYHFNANENVRKNGERVWMEWTNSGIYDADGRLKEFLSVGIDATERKRAEAKLKLNEKKLSDIYASMTEGLALHEIISDHSGKAIDYMITDVNPAFEKITGLNRDQVIGKKASAAYGTGEAPYLDTYAGVASTGMPVTFEVHFAPMNKYFNISVFSPDNGKFATIFQDITDRKLAEESVERFKALMDHNPSLAFLKDESGRYVYLNNAYEKQFALTKDWHGKTDFDFWPKESAELFRANDYEILQSGQVKQYLEDSTDLSGTRYCWLVYKFSFADSNNKRYVGGIGINVTDRVRAEEALQDSEERLRLTLQASEVGTFEIDLSTGVGRWNAIEYELLGLQPGDAPADPETFFRFVHPEDIAEVRAQWEKATRTGRFDAEFRVIRADGQHRWLAGKGQFAFAKTADAGDAPGKMSPLRFLGVNFDITARKRIEEKLAAAHSQLQSVIDNTTSMVYACDLEERFLMANAALAALLKTTPEQMLGKRRHEFMPQPDADAHEAGDRKVIAEGRAVEFEEQSELHGRSITWLSTKFPLRDAQGRIYAVAGIVTDISERKRAEETLKEARDSLEQRVRERTMELQKLMEQLEGSRNALRSLASELVLAEERERKRIATVLHDDICQTLAVAKMRVDMLRGALVDDGARKTLGEAQEFLAQSIREARALMNEVGNPLLFDMGVSAACASLAERLMASHPIRIQCDIPDSFKDLDQDMKVILYQLIRELLNNIVKHSGADNAWISIRTDNGRILTEVRDDGMGFDPKTLGAPTEEGGFGLFSIQERLKAFNAGLQIESAQGKGTVVKANLPLGLEKST